MAIQLWHGHCLSAGSTAVSAVTLRRIATMRLRSLTTFAVAVAATLIASGCANDSPAAPKSELRAPQASLTSVLGAVLGAPRTISPVLRSSPLPADLTLSKTIGILGGSLGIPAAGITIVVPPLPAVEPTHIQ